MAITLGVISDTHGLLRPEAARMLEGASRIIHAGDVGKPEILDALARIAPVEAVRGNVDTADWARSLPLTRTVKAARTKILVLHDLSQLALDPAAHGFAAVISGHSHVPRNERRGSVLYLNPGSAGPRRFRLPVTAARLVVDGASLSAEIIQLLP